MQLRIAVRDEAGARIVTLAGVLRAVDLAALDEACLVHGRRLLLDLRELVMVDPAGLEALRRAAAAGAAVRNARPHLALLIGHG